MEDFVTYTYTLLRFSNFAQTCEVYKLAIILKYHRILWEIAK